MDVDSVVPSESVGLEEAAAAIRQVLLREGGVDFADWLDPHVTWGDCAGADAVLDFVAAMMDADTDIRDADVEVAGDRIVAAFRLGDGGPTIAQAMFIEDGRIIEIIDAADRQHARRVQPVGDLALAAARPWRAEGATPVLPVGDIDRSVGHYRKLGFEVRVYEGEAAYAFAARDGIELHLIQVGDLDPASNTSAYYLYVDDADALYATWRLAEVDGRLIAPVDTEYGLREGAHIDPDGNLVRFGSGT